MAPPGRRGNTVHYGIHSAQEADSRASRLKARHGGQDGGGRADACHIRDKNRAVNNDTV